MTALNDAPLPEYAKPDVWLDENNALAFIRWKDDPQPYQALWWHRSAKSETSWCCGSFGWRNPDPERFTDNSRPLWDLVNWEPLTVAPSLHCLDCNAHGFIREGKWIPV